MCKGEYLFNELNEFAKNKNKNHTWLLWNNTLYTVNIYCFHC